MEDQPDSAQINLEQITEFVMLLQSYGDKEEGVKATASDELNLYVNYKGRKILVCFGKEPPYYFNIYTPDPNNPGKILSGFVEGRVNNADELAWNINEALGYD